MTMNPEAPRRKSHGPRLVKAEPQHIWITVAQLIELYGYSKTYWYLHREEGTGPEFAVMGGHGILYRQDLVEAWFASRLVRGIHDAKYRALKRWKSLSNLDPPSD